MPAEAAVVLDGLAKSFGGGRPALGGLRAELMAGRLTGLVGPDGAGKTTLLRLIAGLLLPDAGRIAVFGRDPVREPGAVRALLGYMPQKFGLYEDLTVTENLRLFAELKGLAPAERPERFRRLLAFTDLARFTSRLAGDLSGGMKQKLGLACTLLSRPRLLLLDEPSVGVDPISRRELWTMVRELLRPDMAVVWSTSYLDEAEKCDRVLLLNQGSLLYQGPPAELTQRARGRVFQLRGVASGRRRVLARALGRPGVMDGVIQGRQIRLLLAPEAAEEGLRELAREAGGELAASEPRFEDAFLDLLGGGPGGDSSLAAALTGRPGDGQEVVVARGLTKRFGNFTAAREIDFAIGRGEIFGLLGPNGAGKSTTFKMMCGLLRPTAGAARVAGYDLKAAPSQARARIGYMAQKFSLYGNLTVRQNLRFFAGVYGLRGAARQAALERMVTAFELAPHLGQPAEILPLGFKQRLALACAVMHEPEVLFLDEPTSGVDPITRREFWGHINGMVEKGITVMVTTHFMDEAEYCDRVGLVYRGELIALGSPDELKDRAAGPELPHPTLEDAFIALIRASEAGRELAA